MKRTVTKVLSYLANPLYWANANIEGVGGPNDEDEYWSGVDLFSLYIEKDRNSYKIWSLW